MRAVNESIREKNVAIKKEIEQIQKIIVEVRQNIEDWKRKKMEIILL